MESRFVYRLFYPQVPIIVCSKSRKEVAAMPANSCIPVSNTPAMVALAVNKKSKTARIIRASGKFSLNWLNYNARRAREYAITLSKPSDFSVTGSYDKLSSNKIPYLIENGQPFLAEAEANALCRVVRRVECGDHDLFLARVLRGRAGGDFLSIKYWQFRKYKPILYLGSAMSPPLTTIRGRPKIIKYSLITGNP